MAIDFEELIKNIVKPLVTETGEIKVEVTTIDESNISIKLLVNQVDLGRVIGKGGKIASAIRTIIFAGASRVNKRIEFTIESL